ncbi:replication endonuclease [Shewanella atlantica]|nr:replication endonuclease [Shewanella atlantica]
MKIKSAKYAPAGQVDNYQPVIVVVPQEIDPAYAVTPLPVLNFLPAKIRRKLEADFAKRLLKVKALEHVAPFDTETDKQVDRLRRIWAKYPFRLLDSKAKYTVRYRKSEQLIRLANMNAADSLHLVHASAEDDDCTIFDAYKSAMLLCEKWMINAPYQTAVLQDENELAAECAILRMICPKWWAGKLSNLRDKCMEHLFIGAGMVGKFNPYISAESFAEWEAQQRSAQQWLEMTMIESESGMMLPLADAAASGTANPSNRFTELVVRARGLEEMAEDAEKIGLFITLTAPSKYHAVSHKWNEEAPKVAQRYLVGQWAKMRAKLNRNGVDVSGLRVVEPHKDGTPHWHLLVFVKPDEVELFKSVLKEYAFEVDGKEAGAAENRLLIEPIDAAKGSAVGYVIKYLSKNIAGEHMEGEKDLTADVDAQRGARLATAWASRHRLRQFQFFGTSSVSIWRELRRFRVCPQPQGIEAARAAADSSNWLEFEKSLSVQPLALDYEITECGNEYGEAVKRIRGLLSDGREVVTRGERWKLREMTQTEKTAFSDLKNERAKVSNFNRQVLKEERKEIPTWKQPALDVDFRSPWTCGNNYTALDSMPPKVAKGLRALGIVDNDSLDILFDGGLISCDTGGTAFTIRDGQLMEVEI